jgi:hypothetical protein
MAAAALALGGLLPADPAAAVSCGGGPVSEGDTAAEVMARCGEPDDRVTWRVDVPGPGGGTLLVQTDAEWVYNFGRTHAMGIVALRDGIVVRAESGSFGYRVPARPDDFRVDHRCRLGTFSIGEVRALVRGLCGAPTRVDAWTERRPGAGRRGRAARVHVWVENWLYDFGPRHFTYTYTFENGRLVGAKSGDYGTRKSE